MTAKDISEIIEKKVGEIQRLGKEVDIRFDKNAIHDFRVEIKSMRSFMRMLHAAHQKLPASLPDKFLEIYHTSGHIREAQLEAATIKKHRYKLPEYLGKLSGDIGNSKIEWTLHYSATTLERLGDKLLSYKYEDIKPKDLLAFIDGRMRKISKLINHASTTDEELHQIRKWLKDIIYNIRLAAKEWAKGEAAVAHVPYEEIEQLSDMIGAYNDTRILRAHLTTFALQTQSAGDRATVEKIVVGGAAGLKTERLKIIAAIRSFINTYRC